jgi:hypothetical protein
MRGRTCRWRSPCPSRQRRRSGEPAVSSEDLEKYETEMELQLYKEYRDVVGLFTHVVETERRFYLANSVDVKVRTDGGEVFFDVTMADAWVWDIYRPARFVKNVRVVTFKDVNVEELPKPDIKLPESGDFS